MTNQPHTPQDACDKPPNDLEKHHHKHCNHQYGHKQSETDSVALWWSELGQQPEQPAHHDQTDVEGFCTELYALA